MTSQVVCERLGSNTKNKFPFSQKIIIIIKIKIKSPLYSIVLKGESLAIILSYENIIKNLIILIG